MGGGGSSGPPALMSDSQTELVIQGRRHQVLFGGNGFMGTQTQGILMDPNPPTPKFSFSSDFGHFISKMLENAKFANVSRKRILKYHNFWGNVPR